MGCIVHLPEIRRQLSDVEPSLKAAKDIMGHVWRTVDYLTERISSLEDRKHHLEKLENEQTAHREKYTRLVRGSRIPRKTIQSIVSFVPSHNKLELKEEVCVDGILPHAVFNPSSILPYLDAPNHAYDGGSKVRHGGLEDIANRRIDVSVLNDESLANSLELRAEIYSSPLENVIQVLRRNKALHRLKSLTVREPEYDTFVLDELMLAWPPLLEELCIPSEALIDKKFPPLQVDYDSLKVLGVGYGHFQVVMLFRSSLTDLTLSGFCRAGNLGQLVHMLSQLVCLEYLCFCGRFGGKVNLDRVPKVKSSSLRSLEFWYDSEIPPLFSECHITRLVTSRSDLDEFSRFFPHVRDISVHWNNDDVSISCSVCTKDKLSHLPHSLLFMSQGRCIPLTPTECSISQN